MLNLYSRTVSRYILAVPFDGPALLCTLRTLLFGNVAWWFCVWRVALWQGITVAKIFADEDMLDQMVKYDANSVECFYFAFSRICCSLCVLQNCPRESVRLDMLDRVVSKNKLATMTPRFTLYSCATLRVDNSCYAMLCPWAHLCYAQSPRAELRCLIWLAIWSACLLK